MDVAQIGWVNHVKIFVFFMLVFVVYIDIVSVVRLFAPTSLDPNHYREEWKRIGSAIVIPSPDQNGRSLALEC